MPFGSPSSRRSARALVLLLVMSEGLEMSTAEVDGMLLRGTLPHHVRARCSARALHLWYHLLYF